LDEGGIGSFAVLIVLITLHALIALAYAALTNSREHYLREQTEAGEEATPRLHITYQLSLLLLQFVIAALAVTALGGGLIESLTISDPTTERAAAYTIVLLPTALITLVIGNLVPGAVGSTQADKIAPWALYPMRLLIIVLGPLVTVIIAISKALASAFGSSSMVNVFTEEEIMTMLDASEKEGTIESEEKEMLYSVLQFGDRLVREVMIPRIDMVAVDINTPLDEAVKAFMDSGHSRIPIYEESIDNIKGLLYAKDLLNYWGKAPAKPIRELMRKAAFVPESKPADELLKELRTSKVHMAIIVDEYGGTAGLITFEDLIEEIVGDIQDEYDIHEEAEFIQNGPDNFTVDASISLNDFNDLLEVEIPTEDSDTLGGFLFTELGRVPEVGEKVEHEQLTMRIETIEGRRIRKVRVIRTQPPADSNTEAPNTGVATQPQPITD
jgi:putative hemolysin